jgi:F-type H+-transporting ATPase subunit gamma
MASGKAIKNRIKSIKNTKKITKAMELVAASKMKRAVGSALASRLYAEYSWEILSSIGKSVEKITHPLFTKREIEKGRKENVLVLIITSNRGLCGAYNAGVARKIVSFIKIENGNLNVDLVTLGKKGDLAMRRIGRKVLATFSDIPDNVALSDIVPISKLLVEEYISMRYDRVLVVYTDFVSPLVQKPNIKQLIPISKSSLEDLIESLGGEKQMKKETEVLTEMEHEKMDYIFDEDVNSLIPGLAEKLIRMQVYQMVLESNASEQSSRMMAMKNASEASSEMIDDLTLMFNKARQANITREISEISAGMVSIS